jgi:quinolinate synthase
VHHRLNAKDVEDATAAIPDALLLVHPECPPEVVNKADYVGSTAGIIEYARKSPAKRFIIGTEMGILHTLKRENPDKQFFLLAPKLLCTNMKKTKIADVLDALRYEQHEITLNDEIIEKAKRSLDRMLEV